MKYFYTPIDKASFVIYKYGTDGNIFGIDNYFSQLRDSVNPDKVILGNMEYWYAFTDSQYYGGNFYLGRLITITGELKDPNKYKDKEEKAKAMLRVFKNRNIEYILANTQLKGMIGDYFTDKDLPGKNFKLIKVLKNNLWRCDTHNTHCVIYIYKVISYEL